MASAGRAPTPRPGPTARREDDGVGAAAPEMCKRPLELEIYELSSAPSPGWRFHQSQNPHRTA
eukprot:3598298-Pyramimonas_sp.AAC.1